MVKDIAVDQLETDLIHQQEGAFPSFVKPANDSILVCQQVPVETVFVCVYEYSSETPVTVSLFPAYVMEELSKLTCVTLIFNHGIALPRCEMFCILTSPLTIWMRKSVTNKKNIIKGWSASNVSVWQKLVRKNLYCCFPFYSSFPTQTISCCVFVFLVVQYPNKVSKIISRTKIVTKPSISLIKIKHDIICQTILPKMYPSHYSNASNECQLRCPMLP